MVDDDLAEILRRARLHPVAARAVELVLLAAPEWELPGPPATRDVDEARHGLASLTGALAAAAWGEEHGPERRFALHAAALASAVLCVAHRLDVNPLLGGAPPPRATRCVGACEIARRFLEPERIVELELPRVRDLLDDLGEGVALDGGRAPFVRTVRPLPDRVLTLHWRGLDFDARGRFLLARKPLTFRWRGRRGGRRAVESRAVGIFNEEGRILGRLALGIDLGIANQVALSHVRTALRRATADRLTVTEDLRLEPELLLARRARGRISRNRLLHVQREQGDDLAA